MTILCDLISGFLSYWFIVQEEGTEMSSQPASDAQVPTAPVAGDVKAASGADGGGSDLEASAREFYWAADVHRMLDMTNASLKDSTRATNAARQMAEELSTKVEELKKINHLLNDDLSTEKAKNEALEQKVAGLQAKLSASVSASKTDDAETDVTTQRAALEVRAKEVEEQIRASLELRSAIAQERHALEVDKQCLEQEVLAQQEIAAELHEVMFHYCSFEAQTEELSYGSAEGGIDNSTSPTSSSFHDAASSEVDPPAKSITSPSIVVSPESEEVMRRLHSRLDNIASKWKETGGPLSPLAVGKTDSHQSDDKIDSPSAGEAESRDT